MVLFSSEPNKVLEMAKTPEDIVASFVKNHALADKHLAAAFKAAERMAKDVDEGIRANMVTQLEAKLFQAQHRAAPGLIAAAAVALAELHIKGTELAQRNKVDLGKLTSVGGVPLVVTKDGGR